MKSNTAKTKEAVNAVTDPIVLDVIHLLAKRSAEGKLKYGLTLDQNKLSLEQWLTHAIEEALDMANYMMRIKYTLRQAANPKSKKELP